MNHDSDDIFMARLSFLCLRHQRKCIKGEAIKSHSASNTEVASVLYDILIDPYELLMLMPLK